MRDPEVPNSQTCPHQSLQQFINYISGCPTLVLVPIEFPACRFLFSQVVILCICPFVSVIFDLVGFPMTSLL